MILILSIALMMEPMTREQAIELAKKTLAKEAGVGEAGMKVSASVAVDWPDTSLGCPQKDMMYAPVLIPGFRVQLEAAGETYDVHVGGARAVVCATPPRGVKPAPNRDLLQGVVTIQQLARQDLAKRLGVEDTSIHVEGIRPTSWPDGSLGCPEPGQTYAQGPIKGFLIKLEHEGKTYTYHADTARVVSCAKEKSQEPR